VRRPPGTRGHFDVAAFELGLTTRPRSAAEDVAQDVFVDVITRLHQFEGRGSFAGWIRSIAISRCLMQLRSPWHRGQRWLAGTSVPIDTLEAQVQWIDHQISGGDGVIEPGSAEQFWRKRVGAMNSLVQLRYVEAQRIDM